MKTKNMIATLDLLTDEARECFQGFGESINVDAFCATLGVARTMLEATQPPAPRKVERKPRKPRARKAKQATVPDNGEGFEKYSLVPPPDHVHGDAK